MKILHTSDWHLGQTFYDYDRTAEQEDMLRQIVNIVRDEQPDAMVVSGDVFHTGNPAAKAVEMYNRALLEMHDACRVMQIVVIAGNHDSASRLVVNNQLWDYFSVTVIGNIAKRNVEGAILPDYDKHIVKVCGADGTLKGYVAAVPHSYDSNLPAQDPDLPRERRMAEYFRGLAERISQINADGLPVVLMAHLAVSGCDMSGHDNVGGMETRERSVFGSGFDYVALGHIHTPQDISSRVRYCGTPIPVNFGEKFQHSVSVVTLQPGQEPHVEVKEIRNLVPLRDFPIDPAPFASVLEQIKQFPADELCYMRLLVKYDTTMTPLADALVAEAVKGKRCRICRIQTFTDALTAGRAEAAPMAMNGDELMRKTPLEVAEMFFRMKGIELTDAHREIIRQATRQAQQNQ